MTDNQRASLESMEGRSFILGREGHIYIDSPTASKHHAELRIENGRVYLRDLKSTNGTFLLKHNSLIPFREGYLNYKQSIVIGRQAYVIRDLLAIASDFVAVDDNTTHVDLSEKQYGRLTGVSVEDK
jgi:hypothetical protein